MEYTDFRQVSQLASNILEEDKKIILLIQEIEVELEKLKATFHDDGIDDVIKYVKHLTQKLYTAQDSFVVIANELVDYAELLKKGKS